MKLSDLTDWQVVTYRLGRAGSEDVNWGPWQNGSLYLQRVLKGRTKGQISVIAVRGAGAEFAEDCWDPSYKVFCVEDYYLEIEGLL